MCPDDAWSPGGAGRSGGGGCTRSNQTGSRLSTPNKGHAGVHKPLSGPTVQGLNRGFSWAITWWCRMEWRGYCSTRSRQTGRIPAPTTASSALSAPVRSSPATRPMQVRRATPKGGLSAPQEVACAPARGPVHEKGVGCWVRSRSTYQCSFSEGLGGPGKPRPRGD